MSWAGARAALAIVLVASGGWVGHGFGTPAHAPLASVLMGGAIGLSLFALIDTARGFRLLRWLRARRRIRRGCCAACGYRLGDACVCPECGTARVAAPHARMR